MAKSNLNFLKAFVPARTWWCGLSVHRHEKSVGCDSQPRGLVHLDGLGAKLDGIKAVTALKSPTELKAAAEHSMHGFLSVLLGEKAFRTDLVVFAVCVAVASAIPGLSWCERALMIYVAFVPLIAELINTAIEKTIDRISLEHHWLSGLAKDIGSSLVSTAFFGAGICWFVLLLGWALRFFRG